jgi:hypothetical protein
MSNYSIKKYLLNKIIGGITAKLYYGITHNIMIIPRHVLFKFIKYF